MLHQKHESYRYVLPLKNWNDFISTKRENLKTSNFSIWVKKSKLRNILVLHIMTTLHNFALKMKTNWAEIVAKPIPETMNTNVVSMLGSFNLGLKVLKRYNVRTNNSQCTIVTIKIR